MQMIRAIIRPGMESKVVESLEKEGCISLTKMEVFGRGKQKGLHIADIHYDELQKTMILMVVEDEYKDKVIQDYNGISKDRKVWGRKDLRKPSRRSLYHKDWKTRTLSRIFGGESHERDYGNNQDEQSPEN